MFILTLIVFGFLWMYNSKNNHITELENELQLEKEKFQKLDADFAACKGEIFHKGKLLEMQNQTILQLIDNQDSSLVN